MKLFQQDTRPLNTHFYGTFDNLFMVLDLQSVNSASISILFIESISKAIQNQVLIRCEKYARIFCFLIELNLCWKYYNVFENHSHLMPSAWHDVVISTEKSWSCSAASCNESFNCIIYCNNHINLYLFACDFTPWLLVSSFGRPDKPKTESRFRVCTVAFWQQKKR